MSTASGWYVTLLAGEKVVRGSTTLTGTVIFGTTTPATAATNPCNVHLGESRIYMMSYLDATSTFDVNRSNTLTALDRLEIRAGGYYPHPVPISVKINGKSDQAAIFGIKAITPPSRHRIAGIALTGSGASIKVC